MGVWIEIWGVWVIAHARHKSLPVWECGLKFQISEAILLYNKVTPCMGVWIEITCALLDAVNDTCHSLYGSVD